VCVFLIKFVLECSDVFSSTYVNANRLKSKVTVIRSVRSEEWRHRKYAVSPNFYECLLANVFLIVN
jgi:hypothetical protein